MKAPDILTNAAKHMTDRAAQRDQATGERSMLRTITAFNAITGHAVSERDGWLFMAILKAARATTTATGVADDYEDGAAYFALAGECAMKVPADVVPSARAAIAAWRCGVDIGRPGGDQSVRTLLVNDTTFEVPERYKFVVQNAKGEVWAYVSKPYIALPDSKSWVINNPRPGDSYFLGEALVRDWRASLIELRS